jgi:hypothetical protein
MTYLGPEAAAPFSSAERRRRNGYYDGDTCLTPVPEGAGEIPTITVSGRKADLYFKYRDANGALLGCTLRWNADGDRRKEFRPLTYWRDANGRGAWKVKTWPAGARPLFGLDKLAAHPDAVVLLFEGEKTSEAVEIGPLADAFKWGAADVIGITWPGGGKAIEHIDFSPLVGRDVVIAPDADEPGEETADKLVEILQEVGVRRLRRWKAPPEAKLVKPDGWDIADELPPKWTPETLVKNILDAPEIAAGRVVLTLPEFLSGYKAPDYLIDGVVQRHCFYSLTAMTGGGKTAIALTISALASNRKRRGKLGTHEVDHVRVVYIACENPDDVRARLIGMAAMMDFDEADLDLLMIDSVTNLERDLERIRKEVEVIGGDVGLVFIDTSAAMFQGDDENSNPQMIRHAKTQRKLCNLPGRPCVIALNHPPKSVASPEQLLPRGGGAYLNETDGNLTAWAHGDRLTTFHWCGKLRGPDFDPIVFRLPVVTTPKLVDSRGRMLPTVMAEVATDAQVDAVEKETLGQDDRLLLAMLERRNGSLAAWAADCGWMSQVKPGEAPRPNRSLAQRVMKRLVGDKLVTKVRGDYTLTKAGQKAAVKAANPNAE